MPPILLGEYRNQHARRQYPFADEASLADVDGQVLPSDFLIDAFMYPIDLVNGLYLSQVNLEDGKIYFADTVTDIVHGIAEFAVGDTEAAVYEDNDYGRQVGILVFGDGLASLFRGRGIRTFTDDATPLTPTAYIPLNQEGVRGFVLPAGELVTGAVTVEGQNGVEVTSTIDMTGRNRLKIDILGVLKLTDEECGDVCPTITEICVQRAAGSLFTISEYDDCTVSINSYAFTLEDICAAQRAQKLPDEDGNLPLRPGPGDDPCDTPPVPPSPPAPGPAVEICIDMEDCDGNFFLVAPSTAGSTNAASIKEVSHVGAQEMARVSFANPLDSAGQAASEVANFIDPPRFTDGLIIGFRGLAQYNRQDK